MPEFKIELDALSKRREAKRQLVSWGVVLLLFAMAVLIFILGFQGRLSVGSKLHWLGRLLAPASLGTVIGASVLAIREAMRRAERKIVFVLDDNGIIRKRKGFPDVRIAFSDVDTLREELRWLVVRSTRRCAKIAIPNNVKGYELIRAELTRHHALAPPVNLPLKSAALKSAAPVIVSVLSWVAVFWFSDVGLVVLAAVIAMTPLALWSRRWWILARRGPGRLFSLSCIGFSWFSAILLLYFRAVRP